MIMAQFAQLFARDADFVNVVGMWWKNRQEIEQAHAHSHATFFKNSRLSGEDCRGEIPAPRRGNRSRPVGAGRPGRARRQRRPAAQRPSCSSFASRDDSARLD